MLTQKLLDFSNIICFFCVCSIKSVFGHYCQYNTCTKDQYCCGENKCCKKTVEVWYFWAAILLIVIAVFVAICLYIRRKKRHKYGTYNPLINVDQEIST